MANSKLTLRKSSSRRRRIIVLAVVIALIGVGASAYYVVKSNQDTQEKQKALDRDRKASENSSAKKDETTKNKTSNNSGSGLPENSTSLTSDQVPTSSALSVNITSTSQANGMVNASAKTSGDGTCVFLYSAGDKDKPITRQVLASGGNCSTSISQNEFSYIGQWQLKVTYYNGGKKAEATQNVTIN